MLLLMTKRKLHDVHFRLPPRSMTLYDLELDKFEFSENFADWDATTAKRIVSDSVVTQ